MRPTDVVFKHIDDLTWEEPRIDIHASIKRAIDDAEAASKNADTLFDFGRRPDLAYEEHIKATKIAADVLPRHPQYSSLKQNEALKRAHLGLLKRIGVQDKRFRDASLVDMIKENNARHRTQPSGKRQPLIHSPNGVTNGNSPSPLRQVNGNMNGTPTAHLSGENIPITNGHQARPKPAIPPKPESLHASLSKLQQADALAARLALLRKPSITSPVQDPRIKTQPLPTPVTTKDQPTTLSPISTPSRKFPTKFDLHDMPSPPKTSIGSRIGAIDTQIPRMPQPPAAIYSPAPSNDTNLPSSMSRNASYLNHQRSNSVASVASPVSTPKPRTSTSDYFSHTTTVSSSGNQPTLRRSNDLQIPSIGITPEQFLALREEGRRMLLVDIRTREEFDKGHITDSSIICIEPFTVKRDITAEVLGERNVVSPDREQKLYDARDQFDLVIYYDYESTQNSTLVNGEKIMSEFERALFDYGFDKQTKRRPILLIGGLRAWVDLMGEGSLQSGSSAFVTNASRKVTREGTPVTVMTTKEELLSANRTKLAQASGPSPARNTAKVERMLGETIQESAEFNYARSVEDVFRRFPSVSEQESMISGPSLPHYEEFSLAPPTRPPPALPRTKSSGISERGPTSTFAMSNSSDSGLPSNNQIVECGLTGLGSLGVQCYINSVTQCLSATPDFRNFFKKNDFVEVPQKENEKYPPRHAVSKLLYVLFSILWSGQQRSILPENFWVRNVIFAPVEMTLILLQACVNQLHGASRNMGTLNYRMDGLCGKGKQHDVQETFSFLMDILKDELNPARTVQPLPERTDKENAILSAKPVHESALEEWHNHKTREQSKITDIFEFQVVTNVSCDTCGYTSRRWNVYPQYFLYFPQTEKGLYYPTRTVNEMLDFTFRTKNVRNMRCYRGSCQDPENSNDEGRAHSELFKISYFPEYMVFTFGRFTNLGTTVNSYGNTEFPKVKTKIPFPLGDIDLTQYAQSTGHPIPPDAASLPRNVKGPYVYRPYAGIYHTGPTISGGHYKAVARSLDKPSNHGKPGDWHRFDDSNVRPWRPGSSDNEDLVMLFLRRVSPH
jgi:ubiquitin carboxyl-terminal hydrolase 8